MNYETEREKERGDPRMREMYNQFDTMINSIDAGYPVDQADKISMYKFICNKINKTLASGKYTCENISQVDLKYFTRIYKEIDPNIVDYIRHGSLSDFMEKCVDPDYRYSKFYLNKKIGRTADMVTNMFSSRKQGGKIARSKKGTKRKRSGKKSKKSKRSKKN